MHLLILGSRGEVDHSAPYHSRHSGLLIDSTLLIDLGEEEFLEHNPEAVLLTHLHPDHAYFVRDSKIKQECPFGLPVYAPEGNGNIKILHKAKTIAGYTVNPILTHHSLKVESQAYRIDSDSKRILYTGDMIWIDKKYHHLLEGLDLVITEGSYMRKGGLVRKDKKAGKIYGHTGIPDLVSLFKDHCAHIVLVHFGSWFYDSAVQARRKIKDLAKKNGITITAGYDNMSLTI